MGGTEKILSSSGTDRSSVMIFVTLGTDHHSFDRLAKEIDYLKKMNKIKMDIFIQLGYTQFIPQYCSYEKFLSFQDMINYIKKSRIIITHGGSTAALAWMHNKIPIVVPRFKKYKEAVDNHQIEYAQYFEKQNRIIAVYDIVNLENTIKNYKLIVQKMKNKKLNRLLVYSNAEKAAKRIEEICIELLNKK